MLWGVDNWEEGEAQATVQHAIAASRHLDPIPESFHIALQAAAAKRNMCLVELLLKVEGINPNFRGCLDLTPLALAANEGHVAIVELLLAKVNVDPNVILPSGNHTLAYSASNGWHAIVKLLLDRPEIDPNFIAKDKFGGKKSALMEAREPAMAKLLLDRENIDVNCRDGLGCTALSYAAYYHRFEVVELLLGRDDINVNLADDEEKVPLYFACRSDCVTTVRLLLSRPDTDPNLVDTNGISILRLSRFRGTKEIESLLLDAGARYGSILLVVRGTF